MSTRWLKELRGSDRSAQEAIGFLIVARSPLALPVDSPTRNRQLSRVPDPSSTQGTDRPVRSDPDTSRFGAGKSWGMVTTSGHVGAHRPATLYPAPSDAQSGARGCRGPVMREVAWDDARPNAGSV